MYAAQPYRNCTRPAPTACQTLAIRFLALLALCVAAFVSTTVVADSGVYKQTLKSTAWVISVDGDSVSLGTGVVIDAEKKLLVTNSHVVGENRNALVFFPAARSGKDLDQGVIVEKGYYTKKSDDIGVQGAVVAIDRKRDLALVELNVDTLPQNVQAIPMADNEVSPGDSVHSIGNPGSSDALWVYSSGTVRAVYKKRFNATSGEHQFRVIETQAPLNTGDSGGPIVNDAGELVGIAQSVSRRGTLVSHCVELSELKTFLDSPWKPAPLSANKLLTATDLKFENHSSGNFEVTVPLDSNSKSTATVYLSKDYEYFERADVRKAWALAATLDNPPSPQLMMKMINMNGATKIGSWAIQRDKSQKYLVVYVSKLDATASSDALKSTLRYVAKAAGTMKKQIAVEQAAQAKGSQLTTLTQKANAKKAAATAQPPAKDTLSQWLSGK